MVKYPYNPEELEKAVDTVDFRGNPTVVFPKPCSEIENYMATFKDHAPIWMVTGMGAGMFAPKVIPDNIARAFVFEAERIPPSGGKDMFGIDWVYEPTVGGSIEDPNQPILFDDANDWEGKINWPDIDSWDWEGSAKANKDFLSSDRPISLWLLNGCWFERLISFMGFENASMALIDEDQHEALNALFEKTTDLYCRIVDKCCEAYGDGFSTFTVHDDWGSQKDCFFSPDVARELIVPHMKKLVDRIHSHGKIANLHSCGCLDKQVENIVEAGWDTWAPMAMNDTHAMYEKYGDRLVFGVVADPFDPETTPEDEQFRRGVEFAKKYPNSFASHYNGNMLTPAFCKGLYEQSRINYTQRQEI